MKKNFSVVTLFAIVLTVTFGVELGIMLFLGEALSSLTPFQVGIIDSLLLIVFLLPFLFFLFFRPLMSLVRQREAAEKNLSLAYSRVESEIEERTEELRVANKALRSEVEEREKAKLFSDDLNVIDSKFKSMTDFNLIIEDVMRMSSLKLDCDGYAFALSENDHWTFPVASGIAGIKSGMKISDKVAPVELVAAKRRELVVSNDPHADEQLKKMLVDRQGLKSLVSAPLIIKDEIVGAISFDRLKSTTPFSDIEVDFSHKLSASISLALENSRLYAIQKNIADTLQDALLIIPENVDGIDFEHLYVSATIEEVKAGGDFYDLFELEHGRIGIIIGDVSGKGLEASAVTSLVKNTIRAYAHQLDRPSVVMKLSNEVIFKSLKTSVFASTFLAIIDKNDGTIRYCCAGHPPPIIRRKSSELEELKTGSAVIGALEDTEYIDYSEKLDDGDIIILYTDGATDVRRGKEFFGERRLLSLIASIKDPIIKNIPSLILAELRDFGSDFFPDDIAILAVSLKNDKEKAESRKQRAELREST